MLPLSSRSPSTSSPTPTTAPSCVPPGRPGCVGCSRGRSWQRAPADAAARVRRHGRQAHPAVVVRRGRAQRRGARPARGAARRRRPARRPGDDPRRPLDGAHGAGRPRSRRPGAGARGASTRQHHLGPGAGGRRAGRAAHRGHQGRRLGVRGVRRRRSANETQRSIAYVFDVSEQVDGSRRTSTLPRRRPRPSGRTGAPRSRRPRWSTCSRGPSPAGRPSSASSSGWRRRRRTRRAKRYVREVRDDLVRGARRASPQVDPGLPG